ncbi:MAG: aminodeoxychorismate/anthranilate synthase component II [Gemmataceae bacterium]|nr:aminodeoxychorismate/anthranilate synthase component II [Gemmataceae bacterium]
MILLLDNDDSFTWNLVHLIGQVDPSAAVRVVRSDAHRAAEIAAQPPDRVIISPGPCGPESAGSSLELIRLLQGRVPILGVCLGMQCLAVHAGLRVGRAPRPVHGHTCEISHDAAGVFAGLASPLVVMRYHSLAIQDEPGDAGWTITARTSDGVPMGLRRVWAADEPHRAMLEGVQFHPESFLSEGGEVIVRNFLKA